MASINDVRICNMVVTTSISKKLDLNLIKGILHGCEYDIKRFPGLIYRQKDPKTAQLLFSSGKVVCTGAKEITDARKAIMKTHHELTAAGIELNATPILAVQNIVATGDLGMSFNLNILGLSLGQECVEYEPEQFPGLVYRMADPKVVILIFSSGKIVITGAKRTSEAHDAMDALIPLLRS